MMTEPAEQMEPVEPAESAEHTDHTQNRTLTAHTENTNSIMPAETAESPQIPAAPPWQPAAPPQTVEETITWYAANDAGNARRFLDAHGKTVRFCADENQWYAFDGVQWGPTSDTHIERLVFQALEESYLKEAQYFKERDTFGYFKDLRKQTAKQGASAGNTKTVKDCVKASAFLNIIEPEKFNTDPYWFHAKNGAICLKPVADLQTTGGIVHLEGEAMHKPERYFTQTAGASLITRMPEGATERNAQCPLWDQFVTACAADDQELYLYLQKAAAYSVLTGDISEQKVFCLLGAGRNGKSLFINTLAEIAGDYACKIESSILCRNRFSEQDTDTAKELFRIKGSRLVYSNEFGAGSTLNEAFIKAITDGGKISCRQLYQAGIEYTPTYTLWFSTNHMPNLQTIDEGIRRRIVVIPFRNQIPEHMIDRSLAGKLRAEYDEILLWLLEGYSEYLRDGLEPPEAVRSATASYFEEQDMFQRFLNESYVIDPNGKIAARTLYQHYQSWCVENGEKPVSNNKFGMEMTRLCIEKGRGKHGIFYYLNEKTS